MDVNKVVMNTPEGEQTLIDLTNDSVTPETLAEGVTAHDASGQQVTGTMPTSVVLYTEQTLTKEEKAQARENIGALGVAELSTAVEDALAQAKRKYGKLVVFGDSIGEGVNNDNYSFVNVLAESGVFGSVVKACVGGATIGPYQTVSTAAGYSLVEQIETYASDVADADIIMLEYGGNDVGSYLQGTITMGSYDDESTAATVCGYLKKALDRIRELNATARIVWLACFWNDYDGAKAILNSEYADAWLLFQATAIRMARSYLSGVVPIYSGLGESHMSSDGIHPNTSGHTQIASKILSNPLGANDYPRLNRKLLLKGDIVTGEDLSLDGGYNTIYSLIDAGVDVVTLCERYGGFVALQPAAYNPYLIQFSAVADQYGITAFICLNWTPDGTITAEFKEYSGEEVTYGTVTWIDTYADTINNSSSCFWSKRGGTVTVDLIVSIRSDVTTTWTQLPVATGIPEAVRETKAMAFYQGSSQLLQVIAGTDGTLKVYTMVDSPAGKTVIASLTYITNE